MKTRTLFTLTAGAILFASCGNNPDSPKASILGGTKSTPLPTVAIAAVSPSPDFPGASLSVSSVKAEAAGKDSAKVTFNFAVKNYELKMQTSDNGNKMCNNSDKGQHIHFILDNTPYKALYEPTNDVTLANNTEHYLMAFLSRSYHESIKTKGAAIMYHFKIDEKGNLKKLEDPTTPMIIYSRPKGDYIGKDTANVLLDFYIWNGTLDSNYSVQADISNEDKPSQQLMVTFTKWEPHFIQNLGTGKCKVKLTLLDKEGKQADGHLTSATREFNLKAQAN